MVKYQYCESILYVQASYLAQESDETTDASGTLRQNWNNLTADMALAISNDPPWPNITVSSPESSYSDLPQPAVVGKQPCCVNC